MCINLSGIEKSFSSSNRLGAAIWCVIFVITFLFIIGFLGVFHPQSYFYKIALVFFLVLAIVGVIVLCLMGAGILRYDATRLCRDLDFSIFNEMDDVIIVSDLSGFVYYSNQNYQKIFTYEPEASCYTVIADLPGVGALLYRLKVAALSGLSAQEEVEVDRSIFTYSAQKKSAWYNISVQPVKKREKRLLFWRIADISHLRKRREDLFLNFQEAVSHLDQAPVGFVSVNAQGVIIYSNAIFAKWFSINFENFTVDRYHFDQLLSKAGINSTWSDILLQSDRHKNLNGSVPYAFSLYLNSGIGEKEALNCLIYSSPLPDESILYRIVMTPQKMQKGESDHQFKLPDILTEYFSASPFAIAVVDQKGQFVHINSPFSLLMGCISKTVSLYDVISRSDHAWLDRAFRQVAVNKNYSAPIETVLKNNKERHLRLYVTPLIQNYDDTLQNLLIISAVETTEQKTLEDEIIQNQKMQAVGQLAGGIAHDFNNVLTAILMSCDLLLNTHRSSDPAHADLINIKNNANRAAALVQQLLAFSRKQTLRPEKVDFTELLSDIRNLILPLLGNNIQLKLIHGVDLWDVEVDQASFQRVIMNLVINARDAISDRGTVTIATSNITKQQSTEFSYVGLAVGEYVQLAISDTGTGISSAVQEKMFEPFFTTKKVGKGTGLGLSMVYGIVKQTGGYIYCDSREGEGTAFHIFLPRYVCDTRDKAFQQIEKIVEQERNTDLTGSATILLVEDEDAVRVGGVKALKMRGYTVLEAASGVEALAILEEKKGAIDVIVSDVVMPEMDGPTLLKESRKNYPDIKFIFVSGYAKDAFAKNLPEDAVFGFLSKPFTLKQLTLEVKETLAR